MNPGTQEGARIGDCDSCHTHEAEIAEYPKGAFDRGWFCDLCAGTIIGNYTSREPDNRDLAVMLGQLGNYLLKEIRKASEAKPAEGTEAEQGNPEPIPGSKGREGK